MIQEIELAATEEGRITAVRARLTVNMGAFLQLVTAGTPLLGAWLYCGAYDMQAYELECTGDFTNTMSTDAYRGAGRPEATYAIERAVDALARELGKDPVEIRRLNFLREFPATIASGLTVDSGDYDALILASAGLRRLGLGERISAAIEPEVMLPAVSQGALGIETRDDDDEANALVSRLDDPRTRAAVLAERALLRSLGGGCQVPIAAHATVEGGRLSLAGLVATLDGAEVLRDHVEGDAADAAGLGEELAALLIERGASRLLSEG